MSDSCDLMDCSLPDSSVHGILQARVLEWVAISFSRGSSRPRDQTWVSRTAGRRFSLCATRESLGAEPCIICLCVTGFCSLKITSGKFTCVAAYIIISFLFKAKQYSVQFTRSCPTLCDPMDCSTPGLRIHHQLLELTQTHVH